MTTPTTETLTAAVATKRAALEAAIAAATQWTGQGAVAFARAELAAAEKALAAAPTATVEAPAAPAQSYEDFRQAQLLARAAARRAAETPAYSSARTYSRGARRGCTCGHCMACIGE